MPKKKCLNEEVTKMPKMHKKKCLNEEVTKMPKKRNA